MAPLISCQDVSVRHGARILLAGASVSIGCGDRIGLIGPNGAGKSTFLKILAQKEMPDSGSVVYSKGLRAGFLSQEVEAFEGSVEEVLLKTQGDYADVRRILGRLGFADPSARAETLSGGWRRRLTLAKALLKHPDVLLLDEPTNHLDLESILWLESFLVRERIPFVVTSHDRVFLDATCNQMWEIAPHYPTHLFAIDGAYAEFMDRRSAYLETQKRQERGLKSKLRREEEWLKTTPAARTTKSSSRIQEAAKLQQEHAAVKRRNAQKKAELGFSHSGRHTRKLITAKNLSKWSLFSHVDISLNRGDRLGIVGENGSGKSTLLKILAQELESDAGTIKWAEDLSVFYFDQHRDRLDLSQPLRLGLSPDGEHIDYQGRKIHVSSWAERFLFTKDHIELPMSELSGGERARVIIARLMTRAADVLLLDEPTNDLDIDTLELLEESLDDFPGAVVLVTHDRAMMDRVADRLITPQGQTYNDTSAWLTDRKQSPKKSQPPKPRPKTARRSLSYKETQELKTLEETIDTLEKETHTLTQTIEDPKTTPEALQQACAALAKAQSQLDTAYNRWAHLEEKR